MPNIGINLMLDNNEGGDGVTAVTPFKILVDTTKTPGGGSTNVTTTSQFRLGLNPFVGGQNMLIDWGDGSYETITCTLNATPVSVTSHQSAGASSSYGTITASGSGPVQSFVLHTYAASGTYTVSMSPVVTGGMVAGMAMNDASATTIKSTDCLKVMQVTQWGNNRWTDLRNMFMGCNNVTFTASDIPVTGAVANWGSTFELTNAIAVFPSNLFDFSGATSLNFCWFNTTGLTTMPALNLPNVLTLVSTWRGCTNLTSMGAINIPQCTSLNATWLSCTNLPSMPVISTSTVTNFAAAWQNCTHLTSFPSLSFAAATNLNSTWSGCSGLTSFPLFSFPLVTSYPTTWNGCSALTSFPLIDFSLATSLASTWTGCTGLTSFPSINTAAVTVFTNTWQNCTGLTSFPSLNVAAGTTFNTAWRSCTSLTSFPSLTFTSGTDFTSAWQSCTGLTTFPALSFPAATLMTSAWQSCTGMTSFGLITAASVTSVSSAWNGCTGFTTFPALSLTSCTNFTSAWQGCTNMTSFGLVVTSAGTTFTSAWQNCSKLVTIPLINTSNATVISSAWQSCTLMTSFPLIDTSKVTTAISAFNGCTGLNGYDFPTLNLGALTSAATMFTGVTLSSLSYSALLAGLSNNSHTTVTFSGGNSKYLSGPGSIQRAVLVTQSWTITDGGLVSGRIITVDTTKAGSASDTFVIPLDGSLTYNFTVNWGDNTGAVITNSSTGFPNISHTYSAGGVKTINMTENVTGTGLPTVKFNNGGDCLKITAITQWGVSKWTTMNAAYYGCSNLTITASDQATAATTTVADFTDAFRGCSALTSMPAISLVAGTNFTRCWRDCTGLTGFTARAFTASTNLTEAWRGCTGMTSFGIITGITGVTNLTDTWNGCTGLTAFPVITFSGATTMVRTWNGCTGLTTFPATTYAAATDLTSAWQGCTGMTTFGIIVISGNGLNFTDTWNGCNHLTAFPNLTWTKATTLVRSWNGCTALTTFPASAFPAGLDFTNAWQNDSGMTTFGLITCALATTMNGTWDGATGLNGAAFPTIHLPAMTDGTNMLNGTAVSTTSYSNLIIDLAAVNTHTGVVFSGGTAHYNAGAVTAHNTLTVTRTWTITDGGTP